MEWSWAVLLMLAVFPLKQADCEAEFVYYTVATEATDGYKRFIRSAQQFGLDVKVLGMGEVWTGGDIQRYPGGGQKAKLLKEALEPHRSNANLVVMFTDSYDVVVNGNQQDILKRFHQFDAKVVFSAEEYCWPDKSLRDVYPTISSGKRYLNSGSFIGYAPQLYEILDRKEIRETDDDQLFYTQAYLDEQLREKLGITLDFTSKLFQNLNGATEDVELSLLPHASEIQNVAYSTAPVIIHGNGASKDYLNQLGNYLGKAWMVEDGCGHCKENLIQLDHVDSDNWPTVTLAVFIHKPTPFLTEFFLRLGHLFYPKSKISLFIHNRESFHVKDVVDFVRSEREFYRKTTVLQPGDGVTERNALNEALLRAKEDKSDYVLFVFSEAQLTNPNVLRLLIEQNRKVIAPMIPRPAKLWTNFWGSVNSEGYYARSDDYVEIVQGSRKGVWNVPYVNSVYLVNKDVINELQNAFTYSLAVDSDMSFCKAVRDKGIFMYITNQEPYGHLINAEEFDTKYAHGELHQIFDNRLDWDLRYIHQNYSKQLEPDYQIEMVCPDVFMFPVVSEVFCQHLIDEMENFGQWSDGTNSDPRLAGGYENVPTRDIHMNQVGLERMWLHFLDQYIRPVQEKVFTGYFHQPPEALMNFVVRYRPGEQDHLRPHHDASTFTVNLALNRAGVDFEGGGARFIRYNCSALNLPVGWTLMHPGRLTHFHEGLRTTKGTRYIMVSFVNP